MVWQSFYNEYEIIAQGRQSRFVSSYGADDGDILVAGTVRIMENVRPALILVRFDKNGRAKWEKIHNIPYVNNIVRISSDGKGSVVLANIHPPKKHKSFWIGFFDEKGELKSSKIIEDPKFDLQANGIHPSIDGDGWVLPVTVLRKWGDEPELAQRNASVYLLNKQGDKIRMRSYIVGLRTELLHVASQRFMGDKKGFIATGYFENNADKKIAWVMRLNPDLSMVWQKEYGRGISAKIVSAVADKNGDVLIAGDVNSAESDVGGAWLAKLDGVYGNLQWQRYYASSGDAYGYNVRKVLSHDDGRISLLMAGEPVKDKKYFRDIDNNKAIRKNYGRLLTLSPRGVILSGDVFYAGYDSYVGMMSLDKSGRCILVGNALLDPYADLKRQRENDVPDVVPLHEYGKINLPDVQLSDKTQQGLALLKNKIAAHDIIKEEQNLTEHGKGSDKKKESAKSSSEMPKLLRKGWVFIPEIEEAYNDPCE